MNLVKRVVRKARREIGLLSFAASGQDFALKPYLGKRGGFFIEAGANDGIAQSNTYWYERFRGWHGLLVEPIPELADRCRRNRPGSRVVSSALVSADYPGNQIEMIFCGLMSQVDGARGSAEADARCLDVGARNAQVTPYHLSVPARTLTSLLDEIRPPKIDFFSLDVESFELSVLQGLDMERYCPTYLLVEGNDPEGLDRFLQPWFARVGGWPGPDLLYQAR